MKGSWNYQFKRLMLPGLKRWICIILFGIAVIVVGVFLLLGFHPITVTGLFLREVLEHAADVLPHRISGLLVVIGGTVLIFASTLKMMRNVLRAYVSDERESIPDVLYKVRHLDSGARIVVIGGGTGLSTLLRGLKTFTSNITAVVTVGDDGGSSGRLREATGVVPPGDIRNCITALADEEKLVTELFSYRFEHGEGLEGHSFGNLFLTAVYSMTNGDILEAARLASRVLNSRGTVLPATLTPIQLIAEMEDGTVRKGESNIPLGTSKIKQLSFEPSNIKPTPEALEAIMDAELIVLGPGSLYTSIIPNLLIPGIADAIKLSPAKKIYIANVLTQAGETMGYSVSDHIQALFDHTKTAPGQNQRLIEAVVVNELPPIIPPESPAVAVHCDTDKIKGQGIKVVLCPLVGERTFGHHDSERLAKAIMTWFVSQKKTKPTIPVTSTKSDTIAMGTASGTTAITEEAVSSDLIDIENNPELAEVFEEERRAQVV
ncbi:MAG: gluconeogenesis factor YvcK family protein [Candidatus Melainabacteria bacterium]|nr:gluconeogenesis factor YvcK family protein [Candidatus Melainabacteria bacterium]